MDQDHSWTQMGHKINLFFLLFNFFHKTPKCRKLLWIDFSTLGFFFHQSRKAWISCCTLSFCSPPSLCYTQMSFSISLLCYAAAFQNLAMFRKTLKNSKRKNEKRWTAKPYTQLTVTFSEEAWKTRNNSFKVVNTSFRSILWQLGERQSI